MVSDVPIGAFRALPAGAAAPLTLLELLRDPARIDPALRVDGALARDIRAERPACRMLGGCVSVCAAIGAQNSNASASPETAPRNATDTASGSIASNFLRSICPSVVAGCADGLQPGRVEVSGPVRTNR